ncbi:MAG TPA: DUF711 family protein [Bryobacteraceae bacterium]|nr:DUF711 family protein [Bryobacteraceae bacterium]
MRKALVLALALASLGAAAATPPKVRAITAFIRIDAKNYQAQVGEAAKFLNAARDEYRASGFEVETIRIAAQPVADSIKGMARADAIAFLRQYGDLVQKLGATPNMGALLLDENESQDPVNVAIEVLASTKINGSLIIASENGIHWKAIREAAHVIKTVAAKSPNGGGNFNFAAIAMVKPYGPFYPGSYHTGAGKTFAVGLESANVVADVFAHNREAGPAEASLTDALTKYLKPAEETARRIAAKSGWTYGGIDPTPAPLGDVSIGRAIESFTGAPFGSAGTMTAAGIITRAVQAVPVQRVGYSGLMVPVLEDNVLARRWAEGAFHLDSLLAYSSVCAGGLDTVPLPGDVTEDQIARILGDLASLAYKWHKPLAARLVPAPGKKAGDRTAFEDSRMANTIVQSIR